VHRSVLRHEAIDAGLQSIERVRYLSLLAALHVPDEIAEGSREDLITAGQRRFSLWRELQQLFATVRRGSLAQDQASIHKTVEHPLHRCWSNARVPRNLRGDLLTVVKALQDPQLAHGKAAARAHELAFHQARKAGDDAKYCVCDCVTD